jgi:hypothetical protein
MCKEKRKRTTQKLAMPANATPNQVVNAAAEFVLSPRT